MPKKLKFKPKVTRVKLNPEQAVLQCTCWQGTRTSNVEHTALKIDESAEQFCNAPWLARNSGDHAYTEGHSPVYGVIMVSTAPDLAGS